MGLEVHTLCIPIYITDFNHTKSDTRSLGNFIPHREQQLRVKSNWRVHHHNLGSRSGAKLTHHVR